ncbi:probable pectinesterase/pectinesterase inhibitor 41 [Zingiber officinale]|uniref:Pectinesterase catalytic domain-containing protein n=1 Tax=Zingiber officinale TaxID=94328 RepID=A0A8J5L8N7_ZINOF|nr:probable pectinesterase/pectinesterase inhibitor 41 [Zingiber officinale]KAG6504685.1 hypothetical protein ZIOFF_037021 [Zingiber officinale]
MASRGALLAFFLLCLIAIGLDVVVLVNQSVRVAQDGTDNFITVGKAIAFVPKDTIVEEDSYFIIYVSKGAYQENVIVLKNKKNLILIGVGTDQTVITSNRNVLDGWKTFNTATFGSAKQQAMAMWNNADLSIFYCCKFLMYQDTLYAHLHCNATTSTRSTTSSTSYLGCTHHYGNTSFSIHNCTIVVASELMAGNYLVKTFLGLPWKEFSRMVYTQSYIEGMVEAAGWMAWNGSFTMNTLYYDEYQNYESGVQQAEGCSGQVTE